jgi:hypothetical protein
VAGSPPPGVDLASAVAADGATSIDLAPTVTVNEAAGINLALWWSWIGLPASICPCGGRDGGCRSSELEMKPEVAACLAKC